MKIQQIQYNFEFEDGTHQSVDLEMDLENQVILDNKPEDSPDWTRLEYQQCSNCPLSAQECPKCPLAESLVNVMQRFEEILSYNKVKLTVTIGTKSISQQTDAQTATSSLIGLMIATSGCPYTEFLKPMAHFHYPLANEEETLFRSTGAFLLSQYFSEKKGAAFSMQALADNYRELNIVNNGISGRLRTASQSDSTLNALVMLDIFAVIFPEAIEDSLKELEYIFRPGKNSDFQK